MVTNQIIKRPMGVFVVEQRTKDGMFNATDLLGQWNTSTGEKKEVTKFFENENTKQFVSALESEENLNTQNPAYLKSRGKNGGTWMHPILFIKFAMWLNPRFEVQVIKFVYDQMIKFRRDAGDAYKDLSEAVSTLVSKSEMQQSISRVSRGVNVIVFGEHYPAIRNDKGEETLQFELFELERKLAELINDGFIKSYDELINYMLKKYYEKYTPKVFK